MDEQQDTVPGDSSYQDGNGVQGINLDEQTWTDRGNASAAGNLRDVRELVNEQIRRIAAQEKQIDEDPSDTSRYAELVSLYLDVRRYDQALSVANQMLGLDPEERIVYDTLASVYQAIGDPIQAAETYARIVTLSLEDADAREHLGTWRSSDGNREEAMQAYEQSVQ